MHPYLKLEIDENVPEVTLIRGLVRAGLDVTVDGDSGTIKVKVARVIDPASGQVLPPANVVYLDVYRAETCCK